MGACWIAGVQMWGAQVVPSEGLGQQPKGVPLILGTLGPSQHKQVSMGSSNRGPNGLEAAGRDKPSWTPNFSGTAKKAGV